MEQLIHHSLILYWWIYSVDRRDLFIPLLIRLRGYTSGVQGVFKKKLYFHFALLFIITIACKVHASAVFHRHTGAIFSLIVGSVAFSLLLGIGVFV